MAIGQNIASVPVIGPTGRALMTFAKELIYLLGVTLNPRQVMKEAEESLLRLADDIEASDPAHARTLRLQARQIGLR